MAQATDARLRGGRRSEPEQFVSIHLEDYVAEDNPVRAVDADALSAHIRSFRMMFGGCGLWACRTDGSNECSILPEVTEAVGEQLTIFCRVLNVAMAKVSLDRTSILTSIGKDEPAGVAGAVAGVVGK